MTRLLTKPSILELSDTEFNVLIRVINSLPMEVCNLSEQILIQSSMASLLLTNEILKELELVREKAITPKKWKEVLDKLLIFAYDNSIQI